MGLDSINQKGVGLWKVVVSNQNRARRITVCGLQWCQLHILGHNYQNFLSSSKFTTWNYFISFMSYMHHIIKISYHTYMYVSKPLTNTGLIISIGRSVKSAKICGQKCQNILCEICWCCLRWSWPSKVCKKLQANCNFSHLL